ncbi:hypothetical protein [Corynebacterium ulceribovis]|uniref:hypothetical protein n=1 Tax=Corynebacterium ulceribovis TaxID=487732 RepID=UPI00037417BA|nr:hypothetical protein [Corynebacterium ulceribovis]
MTNVVAAMAASAVPLLLAQAEKPGPLGPEFGKASPIGLAILVVMFVILLLVGWDMARRVKRMSRRRKYAEEHNLDFFDQLDQSEIDRKMAEEMMQTNVRARRGSVGGDVAEDQASPQQGLDDDGGDVSRRQLDDDSE